MPAPAVKGTFKTADLPLWPGSNRYNITDLRPDLQAMEMPDPVVKWGSLYRGALITGGTHHFYTDDYKFSGLWSTPSKVGTSRCAVAVEANYSIGPETPRWQAVQRIAQKRWLARFWQEYYGIRIVADLNVNPAFYDLAFLGIPRGWRSYATRVHADADVGWEDIEAAFDLACERAGTDDLFFCVFGGGTRTRLKCLSHGWLWHRCSRNWRQREDFVPASEGLRHVHRMPPKMPPLDTLCQPPEPAEAAGDP